jgi:hypothetical protein
MNRTGSIAVAVVLLGASGPASAQSLFATRGLGVPAPAIDARAAALGGIGVGLIGYHTAMTNPAEVAGISRRGVAAALQPVSFTSRVDGEEDGTSGTRFPLFRVIYPLSERVVGSIGYGSYLEQSWAVVTEFDFVVGNRTIRAADLQRSTGGVSQLQLGAAYAISSTLSVGAAAGVLTGNLDRLAVRSYIDTASSDPIVLRPFQERLRWRYFAPIASAGFRLDVAGRVRLSGSLLAGGKLEARGQEGDAEDRTYGAPLQLSAGASARLSPLVIATAGGAWARLPDAGDSAVSRETLRFGGGVEYQGVRSASRIYPVRLGARWAQLPYYLAGESAPTESALGLGLGFLLGEPADPAAVADIALERGFRNGLEGASLNGGVEERLWRFTFSLSLFGR